MSSPIVLGIDLVLGALIGPPGCPAEKIIERAEAGEWSPVVIDLALFCAMSSVRPGDVIDHARFARLLRYAMPMASGSREPNSPFAPPSAAEMEHWRDVVFGRDNDDDEPS
ncbi:MAG: hypothetical protein ABI867_22510 [Kofleriaceae bacterium]